MSELFGIYLGVVTDHKDPEKRGRVKVRVPTVFPNDAEHPVWALPRGVSWGKGHGTLIVPQKGAQVLVTFLEGNPDLPLWEPGPLKQGTGEVPNEALSSYPALRILYQSDRGPLLTEDDRGRWKLKFRHKRRLEFEAFGGDLWINTAPGGLVKVNRPDDTHRAARQGDTVRVTIPVGTVVVDVVSGAPVMNAVPIDVEGTITSGSPTVLIGGQ